MYLPVDDRIHEVVWTPNGGAQTAFLQSPAREVCYGGAVGGGKSDALLIGNLRHVAHPKHRSITFRRERDDLQEIIDRMRDIYPKICPGARWVESRMRWEWPTGSFSFVGSAQRKSDIEAYKSFEFDLINFDELTTFERYQYLYMLSRNRSKSADLPLWVRSGTNPDGPGHGWVFNRFVKGRTPYTIYKVESKVPTTKGDTILVELTQQFIPATIFDNPRVTNRDEYIAGLMAMGEQLAEALLYGKWDYFRGQMFPYGKLGGLIEVDPELKSQDYYVVRALDYGWTDPLVVYWLIVYPQGQVDGQPDIEICAELAMTETTIPDASYLIKAKEQTLLSQHGVQQPSLSEIDPSTKATQATGRSILSLFEESGLWFTPANNDRQAGWGWMRQLLEKGRLGTWRGHIPYLCHTLPKLVRDPDKADDLLGKKQDDHGADTLRYACMAIRDGTVKPHNEAFLRDDPNRDMFFDKHIRSLQGGSEDSNFDALGEGF